MHWAFVTNIVERALSRLSPSMKPGKPDRLSPVLALEIPIPWRPAANRCGSANADSGLAGDDSPYVYRSSSLKQHPKIAP
jgi:hypothetical protein